MRIYVTHLYEGFNERYMTSFIEEVGWGVVRGVGWEEGILKFVRPGLSALSFEDR
jgi:hypothetical protein